MSTRSKPYASRQLANLEFQEAKHTDGAPVVRRACFDLWQVLDRS